MTKGSDRMLGILVNAMRIVVAIFWLTFVLSLTSVVPAPAASIISWCGVFVLAVHLAEYFYARRAFTTTARDRISFVRTMLFGFMHLLPLQRGR